MFTDIITIAHLTFHEARQRKVLLAGLILGSLFVAFYAVGFYFMNREVLVKEADVTEVRFLRNFMVMAGLYAANFLVVMMAVLTPVDTLSGEIASGAIQTLVTKPAPRAVVVLGKWLGFASMVWLYGALVMGGVVLSAWVISGGYAPKYLPQAAGLIMLEGLVMLTLCIMGGTRLSTLANGVFVFGLYGLAFIGGWIERIGSVAQNDTMRYIGIISSLIVPSEALWQMAAYNMQEPFLRANVPIFTASSVPSDAMMVWAVGYLLVTLGAALVFFERRDL